MLAEGTGSLGCDHETTHVRCGSGNIAPTHPGPSSELGCRASRPVVADGRLRSGCGSCSVTLTHLLPKASQSDGDLGVEDTL